MKRWIVPVIVLAVIGFGILGVAWGGDCGPGNHDAITRLTSTDGTETIVVNEGHHGFFPFGLFIFPLGFFFVFFVIRAFAFRGPWGHGPWAMAGPRPGELPGWFDEWHRRAHGDNAPPAEKP